MVKKKSKGKAQQQKSLSPERYMREKVRNLPIGKCYIAPPDWQESGMVHVVITRVRPNGNLVMASFLVDTFCLGVKDAGYHENIDVDKFEEYLDSYRKTMGLKEISYNEAHNLIYGAIAFAEEGGIQPTKEFDVAGYILEEDTDDVPLIEYEFGKNGKHLLIVNPDRKEMPYFNILKKNLGDDFEYVLPIGSEYEDKYEEDDIEEEEYSYQYPDYPEVLSVKNRFIADELLSTDNYDSLPPDTIDRILALDPDEAAEDIGNIVMYVIGRTYKGINDNTIGEPTEGAILHSLILLAHIDSDKGLDVVLEIMRQNSKFYDYHMGDIAPEVVRPALYVAGRNKVSVIEEYLNQPGLDSFMRSLAVEVLPMIIVNHPERRGEIIEVLRRILKGMVEKLPRREACDGVFAGFLMSYLIDIKAKELVPEIKDVFATNCVDSTIAGHCDDVIMDIESGNGVFATDKYTIPDAHEQYENLRKLLGLSH